MKIFLDAYVHCDVFLVCSYSSLTSVIFPTIAKGVANSVLISRYRVWQKEKLLWFIVKCLKMERGRDYSKFT